MKSDLPYDGKIDIRCNEALELSVRIPSWVSAERLEVLRGERKVPAAVKEGYLEFGLTTPGEIMSLRFPVTETREEIHIPFTNATQDYTLTWRGDTVVSMSPPGHSFPIHGRTYPLYQRTRANSFHPRTIHPFAT